MLLPGSFDRRIVIQSLMRDSTDRIPDSPFEPIRRLTVDQYDRMAAAGILTPDDRVELLEGWLVEKMTKNPPHRVATRRTRVAFERIVPQGWYVDTQEPIVTADSEPEPDVAVIRGRTEDYPDRNPSAGDVGLVVEIADSSLRRDRVLKARVYARAGIATYWILDLERRQIEVYEQASGPSDDPRYGKVTTYGSSDDVSVSLDGRVIGTLRVADLLPL